MPTVALRPNASQAFRVFLSYPFETSSVPILPSAMARAAPLGWYIDIAYITIYMNIMAGMLYTEGAHASWLDGEPATPDGGTFVETVQQLGWSQNNMHDAYPNTLSTTAHIYSLSFRPGSGASGYDLPDAPATSAMPTSSTMPPSLRGALPMRTQSVSSTTSIVGLTARTYQDSLTTPFPEYFGNLTSSKSTSEGGDALRETPRGTFLYCLFSPWKWKTTVTLYTPGRKIIIEKLTVIISFGMLLVICSILALMHRVQGLHGGAHHQLGTLPGGHVPLDPRRDMHSRVPPVYNPETDRSYSFRMYLHDVGMWCMLTDMPAHQQAVAIAARLQGQAREIAQLIPVEQLAAGVVLDDGTYVDPVSNLLAYLTQRFAAYPEEERNEAMMEVWHFSRKHIENIDSLVSRFRELRLRAAREGHYLMSVEG